MLDRRPRDSHSSRTVTEHGPYQPLARSKRRRQNGKGPATGERTRMSTYAEQNGAHNATIPQASLGLFEILCDRSACLAGAFLRMPEQRGSASDEICNKIM